MESSGGSGSRAISGVTWYGRAVKKSLSMIGERFISRELQVFIF
jgi:hypothetical protein